jgi:hypothetical protein
MKSRKEKGLFSNIFTPEEQLVTRPLYIFPLNPVRNFPSSPEVSLLTVASFSWWWSCPQETGLFLLLT